MSGRANLLIFVLVSLALDHREGLPRVQVRLLAQLACHRKRDSRGLPHDRRTRRRAIYAALQAEHGQDGALVTEGLDRIATRRPARRNDI